MSEGLTTVETLLHPFSVSLTLLLALLLDTLFGEAKRFHYLVGFGYISQAVEARLNPHYAAKDNIEQGLNRGGYAVCLGIIAWLILVLPLPIIYFFWLNDVVWYLHIGVDAFILYLAIGGRSLKEHAIQVYRPLIKGDLQNARKFTGYLVSRETATLSAHEMSRATVESVLENGHDSVIASLTYYIIGGIPLVIIHRLANTLDAMWGYKTARYFSFGYASARLDDVLGFISGKVCTVLYAVQGQPCLALKNAYQQGNLYKSHNGGWVMSAGATVLNRTLGGTARYHGHSAFSPAMGAGKPVNVDDIPSSIIIVKRASMCFFLVVLVYQLVANFI
ncbi:CobD/CbiB family cobalamin biosynthesis protein [Thalassotalea sp. 1_MG-2023]|uniref:CobD/CbiB family cobalamin biosynthesis protein n=1 Tax=Thalassotalea sp. 1_MG-2023 TaxID=3062680 RepID=UPI0026E2ECEE|nr:CobD/CbiB family cobalamin biosynthesis protein [Thalassotalea sp. 1_MG-2023]MDO6427568.1 CobD/CbiB family cobalamin biosynthesis protein [Thalassotalea sp. 1_MG-2023]